VREREGGGRGREREREKGDRICVYADVRACLSSGLQRKFLEFQCLLNQKIVSTCLMKLHGGNTGKMEQKGKDPGPLFACEFGGP
jgi:hypothetical protein